MADPNDVLLPSDEDQVMIEAVEMPASERLQQDAKNLEEERKEAEWQEANRFEHERVLLEMLAAEKREQERLKQEQGGLEEEEAARRVLEIVASASPDAEKLMQSIVSPSSSNDGGATMLSIATNEPLPPSPPNGPESPPLARRISNNSYGGTTFVSYEQTNSGQEKSEEEEELALPTNKSASSDQNTTPPFAAPNAPTSHPTKAGMEGPRMVKWPSTQKTREPEDLATSKNVHATSNTKEFVQDYLSDSIDRNEALLNIAASKSLSPPPFTNDPPDAEEPTPKKRTTNNRATSYGPVEDEKPEQDEELALATKNSPPATSFNTDDSYNATNNFIGDIEDTSDMIDANPSGASAKSPFAGSEPLSASSGDPAGTYFPSGSTRLNDAEEEKHEEDDEITNAVTRRISNSRVTSYGRTTFVTYDTESTTDSATQSPARKEANHCEHPAVERASPTEEVSTQASTTEITQETDEESGTGKRAQVPPTSSPKDSKTAVADGQESDDDDEDSLKEWEALTEQRARDRRFGCIMFQAGFVGVVVGIILLVLHVTKENNASAKAGTASSEDFVLSILDLPPTTLEELSDPSTPQARAYTWMIEDPWWETYTYPQERARQRMGLATLYFATNGEEWDTEDNFFLSYDTHECDWLPKNEDYKCNVRYQLTSLGLKNMNLDGTLPAEMWSLLAPETLEQVVLAHNDLKGTIGTEIGVMGHLAQLDLSQNAFSGSVPKEIGRCQQLQALILNSLPLLEGTIPSELKSLRGLKGLWWRDTAVRGSIPSELGAIPSLQVIDLSGNLLRGSLPDELFQDNSLEIAEGRASQSGGLQQIRVSYNRLIGTIPAATGRVLNTLNTLDVMDNYFDPNPLPTHLATLTKLTSLQLGGNGWTGSIPSELGLLSSRLESLGLQQAQFTGPIPTEILKLTQLQALRLNDNSGLVGSTIVAEGDDTSSIEHPLALAKLQNLKELAINNTPLKGELPEELCLISVLSFTCDPHTLCGCSCVCLPKEEEEVVATFTVSPTKTPTASPTDPPEASNSTSTPTANLTDTPDVSSPSASPTDPPETSTTLSPSARPTLPLLDLPLSTPSPTLSLDDLRSAFVGNLPNFTQTGLSSNPVDGPQALALEWLFGDPSVRSYTDSRRIQRFSMATLYYALYGAEAAATETAWLSYGTHECFWSAIGRPYATCLTTFIDGVQERVVRGLFLDAAGLTGFLPPEVALFSSLMSLQGSKSNMAGKIPSEIGLLADLETLRLPENKLQGQLPSEIGKCSSLKRIHLGSNGRLLNGPLPTELGLLTRLQTLVLSYNSFADRVPETLPDSLQTLDLSGNAFYGTLPLKAWANNNLKANLRKLRVSESGFRGPLATEIGQFTRLSQLSVSQSQLTGSLPSELGLCTALRSLDASLNDLGSMIPTTLGALTLMQTLHLHDNEFMGTIPGQLGSLTKLEVLTLHNNEGLNGRIPDSLSSLSSLEVLTVNETSVAGRIPSRLCFMDDFAYSCSAWLCGCRDCPCEQL